MPTYLYHCPATGETLEVQHGMRESLKTWGDVCRQLGREVSGAAAEAPVERLISGGLMGTVSGGTKSSSSLLPVASCCGNPSSCRHHG